MENLKELIIGFYTKYYLYTYWLHMGIFIFAVFGVLFFSLYIYAVEKDDNITLKFINMLFFVAFISGLMIVIRFKYLINIELKNEIVSFMILKEFDIKEKLNDETIDMLKELLKVILK